MRTTKTLATAAAAIAAALALTACSSQSPVEQHLEQRWESLGEGGQQTLCTGLAAKGEDWLAEQVGSEYEAEAVSFFVEACEDVDLAPLDAYGFGGIPA